MRFVFVIPCLITIVLLSSNTYGADNERQIEQNLRNLTSENARGYLMPLMSSFAANSNQSTFHSAEISKGFALYIGMRAMIAIIPDESKTFTAISPIDGTLKQTATIVGDNGNDVFPDGFSWSVVPIMVPQLHVGNIVGTQVVIRYLPSTKFDDKIGSLGIIGGGITHSVSQYFPDFPLRFAVQGFFQQTSLGNIFQSVGATYSLISSTRIAGLTLYGGIGYESTDVTIRYRYDPDFEDTAFASAQPSLIELTETFEERFRGTFGISLQFIIFNLNADYSFGNYHVATVGLGISI